MRGSSWLVRGVVIGCLAGVPCGVRGQGTSDRKRYSPPRTAGGQPNISGMWEPGPGRPLEKARGGPWRPPAGSTAGTGSAFTFFAPGDELPGGRATDRSPMVFEPADGIIPLQPWAVARRDEIIASQDKVEFLDPRVRCLQAGVPRANLPVFYNSYQILQTPGRVVILYEWNHMTRIIPLDGRPHLPSAVRLANGDSRGHWEGNSLVIDVTNFSPKTDVQGSRENLHLVERWTRTGPNSLEYSVTMEDPTVWTRSWTVKQEFTKESEQQNRIYYEPRCNEGNCGLPGLMHGLRAQELDFAEGKGPHPATKDIATDFVGVEDDPLQ